MYIAGGYKGVGDDAVATVNSAMVEVEESLRFAFTHHVAAVGIGGAYLGLFGLRLCFLLF